MLATTIHKSNTTPHHQSGATTTKLPPWEADPTPAVKPPPVSHTRDEEVTGLLSQSPIVCPAISRDPKPVGPQHVCCAPSRRHYSGQAPHGSHPHNGSVFRGA